MMPGAGGGFLALWNGLRDPERQAEYETWHAFEHVPERVGSPGFLWARRYRAFDASTGLGASAPHPASPASPSYFTLYALEAIQALLTPRYQALLDHPSDWSAAMRGQLTDFLREPCMTVAAHGLSEAALIAPLRLRLPDASALAAVDAWLGQAVQAGRLVQATLGRLDGRSAHPLGGAATTAAAGAEMKIAPATAAVTDTTNTSDTSGIDAVALLSDFRPGLLAQALAGLESTLLQLCPGAMLRGRPALYQLQSSVRQTDLSHSLASRQAPRPDLHRQFH